MLALIGHNALFSYLTRLHKYGYVCPLHSFCEKEKYDKDDFFKFEQDIRIERKLFYDFLVK